MNNLDWPRAISDLKAVVNEFSSTSESISVIGFCMGGALTMAALSSIKGLKAGGVFYGIPDLNIFRLDKITANVIAHFGAEDPLTGFSDKTSALKLRADCETGHYPIEVKYFYFIYRIYEGASHAFCNQDSKYFHK